LKLISKSKLLQFAAIVLVSGAASLAFYSTETVYQINGICFFRYLAYAFTVVLGYMCLSRYKKPVALAISIALSTAAFSPIGSNVIQLFPAVVPFLLVLMGVNTVLLVPQSRARGFFDLLAVLILPAVLAESRIGGSDHLLATAKSMGYYELAAITVVVIGGCLYLRYATFANSRRLELLSNGGAEDDLAKVSEWSNLVVLLVVICASGLSLFLITVASIAGYALRPAIGVMPLNVLGLALGAGIVVVIAIFYVDQLSRRESRRSR
jgi:hypothetical protein